MRDATDLEILQACIAGDRRAWQVFVERFTRYVYYLIQLTARRHQAPMSEAQLADLHNDVFLAMLEDDRRRLRAFEGRNGCSVRSWVRIITIRKTVDALRRRRVHLSLDAAPEAADAAPALAEPEPDALEQLLARDALAQRERLADLAARLSEQDRLLLELIYVQKLSAEAAAATLRVTRGALYTRKTRLIKRLQALAQDAGLGAGEDDG